MDGLTSLFDPDTASWFGSACVRGEIHGVPTYAYNAPGGVAVVLERLEGPSRADVVISTDPEIADVLVADEQDATSKARQVVELLGRQGTFNGPEDADQLLDAVPLRLGDDHALKTSLGRLGGRTIGVVEESGPLDATAAEKGARFVRMCDAFGIPLIAIAGSPQRGGEVHGGAELLHAFAESVVPRITLVTGLAHVTMIAETTCSSFVDPRDIRRALVEAFCKFGS
jgi:hypothetical protein